MKLTGRMFALGVSAALAAAPGLCVAASPASGAAFPKGHYAALDRLPDWGGVWTYRFAPPPSGAAPREEPVLKGKYLDDYRAYQQEVRERQGLVRRKTSNCMPPGMPVVMMIPQYPLEFLFTPGRITTLHEAWMQTRTIFTDGRSHPDDWEGGIFGHSIGQWEGDTLVVETVGIKTITDLSQGMAHSEQLRIVERIHLLAEHPDILVVETTMTDPEALEKPYRLTHYYDRHRDQNLMEFICAENDRNPVDEHGDTTFE